ncbi:sirohydrochlorin chelatase [Corallincola spongiicola]|uniref:Cobalamin biosynthesis protein CbiX n=1 Tax=Corallincola spongiicola TaxID=2520508 RepID=A0ABY1WRR9_9GAMM|nr:CbiX/SirB N-terminal domain-containing protein [Corallincola spongiicola]TAA47293.1 cobalamin biosynthesis protein CbiX [Corallincola spongiicola]
MQTQSQNIQKRALLLVAHGSRRQESNQEVIALGHVIAAHQSYALCEAAFLELASPSIKEGFERLIALGATEIDVMPYFLAAGRHVVEDIPEELEACQRAHPSVPIKLAPHLAAVQGQMAELVIQLMATAKPLDRQ